MSTFTYVPLFAKTTFSGVTKDYIGIAFKFSKLKTVRSLFVFSINGLKQNARSLLTPVSHPDFYALSHGSLHFGLYGS